MDNKRYKPRNSQAFSLDIMLAVIIFIGTILFFYAILNTSQGSKADELEDEASKIIKDILSEGLDVRISDGTKINSTKLEQMLGNYSGVKSKLKVKNDFCIYFVDEDGNIIYVNISESRNYTGIGSEIINVSSIPCG